MKRIVSLLLAAVLAPLILCQSAAAEGVSSSAPPQQNSGSIQKAVVFTLDASNSMNGNDRNRLAIDSIAQLIYSLPSNYVLVRTFKRNKRAESVGRLFTGTP